MKDRVSTKILNNGATRYGVYDETGALLRYEYIKLEDEPSTEGDFFNKANMLPDSITAMLGLKMSNPQVADALNVLANIGNIHVWERAQSGVTDYLTSTDRNAYPDQSAEGGQDASYVLGDVVSNYDLGQSGSNVTITYSSDIAVDDRGMITLVDPGSIMTVNVESLDDVSILLGKFVKTSADSSGNIVFIPTDATASYNNVSGWSHIFMSKYQPVTGHAAIPANTTITYLGQLGGGARIEVGSYVGTGTYGSSNPNSLTFGFEPQLVAIFNPAQNGNYAYKMFMLRNVLGASVWAGDGDNLGVIVTWSAKSVTWYTYRSKDADYQMNYPGETYNYIAIG